MAFNVIDSVKINSKNTFGNSYIYSVSFDTKVRDEPSKMTISFVNRDGGNFLEPEIGPQKNYKIEVGNSFVGNFNAYSRKIVKSSDGRLLQIVFVDTSTILDRIYVQLYKRGGTFSQSVAGLIIVGQEIHPCDFDNSGTLTQSDINTIELNEVDGCEVKCPADPGYINTIGEKCIDKMITDIFEVKYNFNQLLDTLEGISAANSAPQQIILKKVDDQGQSTNITYNLPATILGGTINAFNKIKLNNRPANINNLYFKDFTGTLREVLKNWCAEFGFTFVWENDGLTFIDTKTRPKVNFQAFANLESTEDELTYEGTVSRGAISHYAEPGILAKTDCPQVRPLFLRCLSLKDLYGDNYLPTWKAAVINQGIQLAGTGPLDPPLPDISDYSPNNQQEYKDTFFPDGVPIDQFETSCVCAYYSPILRNAFNFYNYYGITGPDEALSKIGSWMDRLGQVKIINVFSKNSSDNGSTSGYNELIQGGFMTDTPANTLFSKEISKIFSDNNAYFIVVERLNKPDKEDREMLERQYRVEENLANNFIGVHWIRPFISEFFGTHPQMTQGAQYYAALSVNAIDLPFTQFNHTYKSTVSKLVSSYTNIQKNDFSPYGPAKFVSSTNTARNQTKKLVKSIIYHQKNTSTVWNIPKASKTQLAALIESLETIKFRKLNISNFNQRQFEVLKTYSQQMAKTDNGKDIDNENLELWVCFPLPADNKGSKTFKVVTDFTDNLSEENPSHEQDLAPFALSTFGLTDKKCVRYNIQGIEIFTPAAASTRFSDQTGIFKWLTPLPAINEFSTPKYKIYIKSTVNNRGIIDKSESVLIKPANPKNVFNVDYLRNEVTKSSLQLLNKLTIQCGIPDDEIKKIHDIFTQSLNFDSETPFRSISYSIYGTSVGQQLKISQGLESFTVTISAEGAVKTNFTITDKIFTPESPDFILKKFELEARNAYLNYRSNPL